MGTKADDQHQNHLRNNNNELRRLVTKVCRWIFQEGYGVAGKPIKDLLGNTSQLPNQVRANFS
jgi:hypothetical protein